MNFLKSTLVFCAFGVFGAPAVAQSSDNSNSKMNTESSVEIETKAVIQPAILIDSNPDYHPSKVKVVRLEAAPDVNKVPAGAVSSFDQKFVYRHDQKAKTRVFQPATQKDAAIPNKFSK